MGRNSLALLFFVFTFGLLIGAALLVNFNFFYTESRAEPALSAENEFASGTKRLDAYKCAPGETKQIILGGVEDNYDPGGVEDVTVFPNQDEHWKEVAGPRYEFRNFDEGGENKNLIHRFNLSERTYRGIVVTKFRELSNLRNDFFIIMAQSPDLAKTGSFRYAHQHDSSSLTKHNWQQDGDYLWANLDQLDVHSVVDNELKETAEVPHLLEAIRRQTEEEDITVKIGDDTQVDFMGFAICLEPEQNLGTVYSSRNIFDTGAVKIIPDNVIYLSWAIVDGKICNQFGCRSCDTALPVACIHDQNLKPPADLEHQKISWSGGHIDFTKPVPASRFKTEDQVDAFCQSQFGVNWRTANIKDGSWQQAIMGYGEAPKDYDEYWVGVKNSAHYTCWEKRLDYSELNGANK